MAKAEQLAILKKGSVAWNAWRQATPSLTPDLKGADLREAHLNDAQRTDVHGRVWRRAGLPMSSTGQAGPNSGSAPSP